PPSTQLARARRPALDRSLARRVPSPPTNLDNTPPPPGAQPLLTARPSAPPAASSPTPPPPLFLPRALSLLSSPHGPLFSFVLAGHPLSSSTERGVPSPAAAAQHGSPPKSHQRTPASATNHESSPS